MTMTLTRQIDELSILHECAHIIAVQPDIKPADYDSGKGNWIGFESQLNCDNAEPGHDSLMTVIDWNEHNSKHLLKSTISGGLTELSFQSPRSNMHCRASGCAVIHLFSVDIPTPRSSATCLRVSPLVSVMRTASWRNSSARFSPTLGIMLSITLPCSAEFISFVAANAIKGAESNCDRSRPTARHTGSRTHISRYEVDL